MILKRPLTENYRSTFKFQGALLYNKLPENTTSASNLLFETICVDVAYLCKN